MHPAALVDAAVGAGLDGVAVCDHNSAENVAAVQRAARPRGLAVIPGMEITTAEEVHVVGLFPDARAAMAAADEVQATLPEGDDAYRHQFGGQRLLDADGQVVGTENKMLAVSSTLDLSAAVNLIHRHRGLAVAAHVNRPSFSVLSQLGLFPPDAGFDALEVFTPCDASGRSAAPAADPYRSWGLPILASSDSHFLGDIGRCHSVFTMAAPTFDELALALRGVGGRGVRGA